jgi:hypothetical protein
MGKTILFPPFFQFFLSFPSPPAGTHVAVAVCIYCNSKHSFLKHYSVIQENVQNLNLAMPCGSDNNNKLDVPTNTYKSGLVHQIVEKVGCVADLRQLVDCRIVLPCYSITIFSEICIR